MNATNESISVTVDDCERGSAVTNSLLAEKDAVVRIERLPEGDYQAVDRQLFERETLRDFVSSIINGRHELQSVAGTGDRVANDIKSAVKEQISYYGYDEDFPI